MRLPKCNGVWVVRGNGVLYNFCAQQALLFSAVKREFRIDSQLDQVLGVKLNLSWRSSGTIEVSGGCNVWWSSLLTEHRAVSLGCCSGHYHCCLLKLEPAEVPSYGHQISWSPCYLLTQILPSLSEYHLWFHLDMMEIIHAFISVGGLAHSEVQLLPHLMLHTHKLLWEGDALWEL